MSDSTTCLEADIRFDALGLSPEILEGIQRLGFDAPTACQTQSIPLALAGKDLIIQSSTGTGKTLAFGLPVLERLKDSGTGIGALVLCPTRELAVQVCGEMERVEATVKCIAIYGGDSFQGQLRRLHGGGGPGRGRNDRSVPRVIVGTPGRVRDHIEQGTIDLSHLKILVFDEADEMLEMGFRDDLDAILGALPVDRQTILVSATISPEVEAVASRSMRNPERVGTSVGLQLNADITHSFFEVREVDRYLALVNLLHYEAPSRAVVFCHTRRDTEEVSSRLAQEGFRAGYLSGDLQQAQRNMTLEAFRRGDINLLVATDVAARGIDIQEMTHVINFHVPAAADVYVHRTGRTGRAGRQGEAWTLVAEDYGKWVRLVREIRLKAEPRQVPSRSEVQARRRERFLSELQGRVDAPNDRDPMLHEVADKLLQDRDARRVIADLLGKLLEGQGGLEVGYDVHPPQRRQHQQARGGRPFRGRPAPHRSERSGSAEPEIVRVRGKGRPLTRWEGGGSSDANQTTRSGRGH